MKIKVVGIILIGMCVMAACSFSKTDENDMSVVEQSIKNADEKELETETDRQKRYEQQLLSKYIVLAEFTFPEKIQRALSWEEKECSENLLGKVQVPILDENGMQDMSWFCDDICEWIEMCLQEIPYKEAPWLYKEIIVAMYPSYESFDPSPYIKSGYDREALYAGLYDFVDKNLNTPVEEGNVQTEYVKLAFDKSRETEDYSSYMGDCSYATDDGIIYEMIPVDRAAGSNYYVLISYKSGRSKSVLINSDPFSGSGGEAKWISFIDDTTLGFACLSYNGGDDALLFRTTDGGKSFTQVNFPSARIKLSDGSLYNPFTIPEKVWLEEGNLYMLVGQSAWSGDYYNEELEKKPSGLYVSHNDGLSFEYVGEQ